MRLGNNCCFLHKTSFIISYSNFIGTCREACGLCPIIIGNIGPQDVDDKGWDTHCRIDVYIQGPCGFPMAKNIGRNNATDHRGNGGSQHDWVGLHGTGIWVSGIGNLKLIGTCRIGGKNISSESRGIIGNSPIVGPFVAIGARTSSSRYGNCAIDQTAQVFIQEGRGRQWWMDIHRRGNPWAPKSVPYLYCVGSGGQVFKNVLIRAQWVWVEPIDSIPSELIVSISAGHGHYNCSFIISNHTSGWENLKNDG